MDDGKNDDKKAKGTKKCIIKKILKIPDSTKIPQKLLIKQ